MNGDFRQSQLLRRFEPGVTGDDDAFRIDDDRLAESELPQARRDGIYRLVIEARVLLIGFDFVDIPKLDGQFVCQNRLLVKMGKDKTEKCVNSAKTGKSDKRFLKIVAMERKTVS